MNAVRSFVAFVLLPLASPLLLPLLLLLPCGHATAAAADEIPAEAPRDALMASDAQLQTAADWACAAFAGRRSALTRGGIAVEVQRQDHNVVQFGQSCTETPLRIGSRGFAHGLGVHAASVVVVSLPASAKRFQAMVVSLDLNRPGDKDHLKLGVQVWTHNPLDWNKWQAGF